MLSSPVYVDSHRRKCTLAPAANSSPHTFLATPHPLTPYPSHSYENHRGAPLRFFLTLHSLFSLFDQRVFRNSFPINRFHTLSQKCRMPGDRTRQFLKYYFNSRPPIPFPAVGQTESPHLFSMSYELPIFYPLCFDIHPCNGGWVGGTR